MTRAAVGIAETGTIVLDHRPDQGRRVLVARVDGGLVGFAVDAVEALVDIPADRLAETPELAREAGRLFDRVAQVDVDGRPVLLVNPQELLDQAERDVLAGLAAGGPESA